MTLFPRISRIQMVSIHVLVSFALANLGLQTILNVVAPINQLIYPIVICIVFIALFDIFVPGELYWTYRLAAWLGACFGVLEALRSIGDSFNWLLPFLDSFPLGPVNMSWVTPALLGFAIGLIIDTVKGDHIWTKRPNQQSVEA